MGRNKLHKTREQIAEQKHRWFGPARNKRRRKRYAADSAYRETVNSWNRTSYRQRSNSKLRNCRDNISELHEFGSIRIVPIGDSRKRIRTFSVPELAKALGDYHPVVLYRWQKERKFPRPVIPANDGKVYTEDQARKLLTIMSEHQDKKLYFHKTDARLIEQLFKAMASI
jgi:hypothetical protein